MSYVEMAAHAGDILGAMRTHDRGGQFGVACTAGVFRHPTVSALDLDDIRESTRGKSKRVKESVRGFHCVLPDEIVRRVAIVASRD